MEEVGRVVEVSGDTVRVELEATERCSYCGAKILCHPGASNKMYIEAINEVGARLGDKVKIGIGTKVYFLSAFLLFIAPIVAFLVCFVVTRMLTGREDLAVVCGLGGVVVFFVWLVGVNRKVTKSKNFHPVVKEIMRHIP